MPHKLIPHGRVDGGDKASQPMGPRFFFFPSLSLSLVKLEMINTHKHNVARSPTSHKFHNSKIHWPPYGLFHTSKIHQLTNRQHSKTWPNKWMENSLLTVGFCSLSIHSGGGGGETKKEEASGLTSKQWSYKWLAFKVMHNQPTQIREPSKKPHSVPSTMKWRCNDHPSARPILLLTPKLFSFFFFKKKSAGETDSLISLCAVWVDV